MLGLSGELGKGALGEFALAEPEQGEPFVPHAGAIAATDAADSPQAEALTSTVSSTVSADTAQAEVGDG